MTSQVLIVPLRDGFRLTLRETDRDGRRTIVETQIKFGATDAQQ
jgi:hypothetical protein